MSDAPDTFSLRSHIVPGDLGTIVRAHGTFYAQEYGLDITFEPYVARPLADFVLAGPGAGRLWIAERGADFLGSIALVNDGNGNGRLRWFLVVPKARGLGLGGCLLDEALAYAAMEGVGVISLWTFAELRPALALYEKRGFVTVETVESRIWGRVITEIRMERRMPA